MKKQKTELTIDTTITRVSQNTISNKATRSSHSSRSTTKEKEPDFIEQLKKISPEELNKYKQALEEKRAALHENLFPYSLFTGKSINKDNDKDQEKDQDTKQELSPPTRGKSRKPIWE
jgi:hypothetical protein